MIRDGALEAKAIQERMALGDIADELGRAIAELEDRMRAEIS